MTSPSKDTGRVEHTPTPWRVFRSKNNTYVGVGEHNGEGILDAGFGLWRSGPEREANAELIVRAVNAHDSAARSLQIAIEHIGHMAAFIAKQDAGYSFESLGEDMPGICATLSRLHSEG